MNGIKSITIVLALMAPVANAQENISPASAYKKIFRLRDAELLKQKLQTYIDHFQKKSMYEPVILFKMMLADQYEKTGDYTRAEVLLTEASETAKKNLAGRKGSYYLIGIQTQKTIFDAIDRLGYFYLTTGNLRKAADLFHESKRLRDSYFPPLSVHRIHPLVGLGSLYYRKGHYERTYDYFRQAERKLQRATTTGYNFDQLNRLFLNDLAAICLALGKLDEARKIIDDLAIASSGKGKYNSTISSNLEIARIFEMKARYFLAQRDFKSSRQYLEKANLYNPPTAAGTAIRFRILKTEALLHWCQNDTDQAGLAFKKLVASYRDHIARNFVAMSEYEKERFYYTLKDDFDLFNAFAVETQTLFEEVYDNTLNTKGILLNETNRIKNAILKSGSPDLQAKLKMWEQFRSKLSAMYYEKNPGTDVQVLERNIESIEKEINAASGLFGKAQQEKSWQQVKSFLGPDEAAIEIIRVIKFDKTKPVQMRQPNADRDSVVYLILSLTPSAPAPRPMVLRQGANLEGRNLSFYRNSMFAKSPDALSYDQFWRPIVNAVKAPRRIYISPDGVYNQINVNTLKNPSTGNYVIDETDVVYVTSTGDLLKKRETTGQRNAILVGRPSFQLTSQTVAKPEADDVYGTRNLANEELLDLKGQAFADLPGTEEEIAVIEATLKARKMDVVSFKGAQALEENVKAVSKPAILHIATHGFFVGDTANAISPMIRSGIVLAGVRNKFESQSEDGILTAYEATNIDLEGTSLVVLSACETGVGEVRNGEGVYGLQRAIMVAGAKNLLMSLWKIDDLATARLMATYYRLWSQENNASAFRQAQIDLRKEYPEPYYWGAFVMLGN
jgi:CHAT domain-containing protein/tetratricopeptide (TPR) repeat protein